MLFSFHFRPGNKVPAGELEFAGAEVPVVFEPRVARGEGRVESVGVVCHDNGKSMYNCLTLNGRSHGN